MKERFMQGREMPRQNLIRANKLDGVNHINEVLGVQTFGAMSGKVDKPSGAGTPKLQ